MNVSTTTQRSPTGRLILNIQAYRSIDELKATHPNVKSWTYIYQVPHRMSVEEVHSQLVKIMQKQGTWYSMVYHVGDFIIAPAVTTETMCICLEHIGDNGPCPKHGTGHQP